MKPRWIVAVAVAVLLAWVSAALAQTDLTVSFTITAAQVTTLRTIAGKMLNVPPASVTDAQIRTYVGNACRDTMAARVREFRQAEDRATVEDLLALTDAEREQVRQYILSLKK